jgi:hypothetical protein
MLTLEVLRASMPITLSSLLWRSRLINLEQSQVIWLYYTRFTTHAGPHRRRYAVAFVAALEAE